MAIKRVAHTLYECDGLIDSETKCNATTEDTRIVAQSWYKLTHGKDTPSIFHQFSCLQRKIEVR